MSIFKILNGTGGRKCGMACKRSIRAKIRKKVLFNCVTEKKRFSKVIIENPRKSKTSL